MSNDRLEKEDKIFEAITGISEKHIEEAADYSFKEHSTRPKIRSIIPWHIIGAAAAGILVIGGTIVLFTQINNNNMIQSSTYATTIPYIPSDLPPTEANPPTTAVSETTTIPTEESFASNPTFADDVRMAPEQECSWDEYVPGRGKINSCSQLSVLLHDDTDPHMKVAINIELVFYTESGETISFGNNDATIDERMEAELKRLSELGYDVHRVQNVSCGYLRSADITLQGTLTKEQLKDFPCDPNCGYYMCWIPEQP